MDFTGNSFSLLICRKSSKPHEDIIGIRSQNQGSLAQGKNFLMSKFSSLNQKVKQTKSNVNIGNLRKLGNFTKPEMKVNFLKPNLKVNLWKSDSSLETMENTGVMDNKVQAESDGEMSSDNDSYHSDEFLTNSKSDEDRQLANSLENVGPIDYVLPSCGIIASAPRLGSRSQSLSSTDISIHVPPEGAAHGSGFGKGQESPLKKSPSADNIHVLTGFAKPVDIYCHRFVRDAQNKMTRPSEVGSVSQQASEEGNQVTNQVSNEETPSESTELLPSRPSQLDVASSASGPQYLSVEPVHPVGSQKTPGSGSSTRELETGLPVTPSPSEGAGSRAVSPFAKIRSSMVQVASITQAGLTQGINFAVAKVQKSPAESEVVQEVRQNELKNMFTQCQTRIIQI